MIKELVMEVTNSLPDTATFNEHYEREDKELEKLKILVNLEG